MVYLGDTDKKLRTGRSTLEILTKIPHPNILFLGDYDIKLSNKSVWMN